MSEYASGPVLQIKKYPNRRFYDATRSCHVTLQGVYELILDGHLVVVTDSRSGEDITNMILVQIMLDKDPRRLHLFPSWVFHLLLRSSPGATHSFLERFLAPLTHAWDQGRRQFDELADELLAWAKTAPANRAGGTPRSFTPHSEPASDENREPTDRPTGGGSNTDETLEEMKSQAAALSERVRDPQRHRRDGEESLG